MFVGEVRAEEPQIISFIAKMVVNHVKHYSQADCMRGIDQSLETFRSAITCLHCVGRDAIITPVARAGKSRDGHDFNYGDAKFLQVRQLGNGGIERSFRRKRANMEFVDYVVAQWKAAPGGVSPRKAFWIDDLSWAVNTFRQQPRYGIRNRFVLVDDVKIFVARTGKCLKSEEAIRGLHWPAVSALIVDQTERHALGRRRPDTEVAAIAGEIGAESFGRGVARHCFGRHYFVKHYFVKHGVAKCVRRHVC